MTRIKVDPHTVWIESVSIDRVNEDRDGLLRAFHADVMVRDPAAGELTRIGSVRGLIAFESTDVDLAAAADAIGADALNLTHAAGEIRKSVDGGGDATPSTLVLIEQIRIEEHWRGGRIAGHIIDQLLEVLHLDPGRTLLVLEPEPSEAG